MILKIFGRVQGVGFRYFVSRVARAYGLFGFVRNEMDGSVLVEFNDTEKSEIFLQKIKSESPGNIDKILIEESHPNFKDFKITF
ncbi:acylphosphatase [Candidatus Woesearchaeota archaeon]|nr:acylphosphatase [Candidatus Woesearchaeota archaeon]